MRQPRTAFTLVEMLVAVALTLFVMVLLSQAFTTGLEAFRQLKAVGDIEERMRMATTILRRDLIADHFEGRKRLSDPDFFKEGPPREGFFRIWHGTALNLNPAAPYVLEGGDGDGIASTRATDHALHFTVKLRGNSRQDFFSTNISSDRDAYTPPSGWALVGQPESRYQSTSIDLTGNSSFGTYTSQWAEVIYHLRSNGSSAAGTPLYTLYRRQLLALPDNDKTNWPPPNVQWDARRLAQYPQSQAYAEISCKPKVSDNGNTIYFNNPTDLTVPQRRFGMNAARTADGGIPFRPDGTYPIFEDNAAVYPDLKGSDVLLTDVISFDIKVFFPGASDFSDLPASPPGIGNPLFSAISPRPWRVFDTWTSVKDDIEGPPPVPGYDYLTWDQVPGRAGSTKTIPLKTNILAIKVTLRVWDPRTQRTRQVTIIQDM